MSIYSVLKIFFYEILSALTKTFLERLHFDWQERVLTAVLRVEISGVLQIAVSVSVRAYKEPTDRLAEWKSTILREDVPLDLENCSLIVLMHLLG
jgi:hypothetical protein